VKSQGHTFANALGIMVDDEGPSVDQAAWKKHIMLDKETGLDPPVSNFEQLKVSMPLTSSSLAIGSGIRSWRTGYHRI